MTVLLFLAVRRVNAGPGDSYLSMWPLHGYEAVAFLLLGIVVACIDACRDWRDIGSDGR